MENFEIVIAFVIVTACLIGSGVTVKEIYKKIIAESHFAFALSKSKTLENNSLLEAGRIKGLSDSELEYIQKEIASVARKSLSKEDCELVLESLNKQSALERKLYIEKLLILEQARSKQKGSQGKGQQMSMQI